jgi:tRNA (guanosine-2'-O-)-methyltransferase
MTDRKLLQNYLTEERVERLKEVLNLRRRDVTVVLENLHKEHNMDAVMRTCEAFGLQHVHVVPKPEGEPVLKDITLGCHGWLTVHHHEDIRSCFSHLRKEGYTIWAGSLGGEAVELDRMEVAGRQALVFSNELQGASPDVLAGADGLFIIPLEGFSQSLNVSVAAGIVLHHLLRDKSARGESPEPLPHAEKEVLLDLWVHRSVKYADEILKEIKGRSK